MSAQEVISSEEYCRSAGIKPIPATEGERITAILEHQFTMHRTKRPSLTAYLPWMVVGVVLGLTAFQILKPWVSFATA